MNSNPAASKICVYFAIYLIGVVFLACLLSPPLYWMGASLASRGILPFLEGISFHRYFSRCILICALALLWPAFRALNFHKLSELGLESNSLWKRDLVVGISVALVPIVLLGIGYLSLDIYRVKKELVPSGVIRILCTASVVAVLEEFLFRGVILGLFLRMMRPATAAVLSSLIFAVVHFMRVAKPSGEVSVNWLSGFAQMLHIFSGAPPWPLIGWGLLSLFLAGLLLALASLWTRSLFLAIGLHAGWIIGQQGLQWLAKFRIKSPGELLPWVGPNVVSGGVPTGIIPILVLLSTAGWIILYLRHEKRVCSFS